MRTKDIIKKVIPKSAFLKLKLYYNKYKKSRIPVLSEADFRAILTDKLGLKKGQVVFIHSSTGNMNLGFPVYRMLNIILDILGEEGTALFPCHQLTVNSTYALQHNIPFDVRKTPSEVGLLPELARRHKGAVRSLHPTNSIVAIGKYAHELLDEHHLDIYPCGEKSPYYKIMKYDGIIIGIGVLVEVLTFVHCVEDIMRSDYPLITRNPEVYHGEVITNEKKRIIVDTLIAHPYTANKIINQYFTKYVSRDVFKIMNLYKSPYFVINSKDLFEDIRKISLKGITIYK